MKFRNVRIAWSTVWGTLALLLCVLWVQSHSRLQIFEIQSSTRAYQVSSVRGQLAVARLRAYKTGQLYKNSLASNAAEWRIGGASGFAWHNDGSVTALLIPHWFAALLLAAMAVALWALKCRQFSLRTLLSVTTIVAIALGLISLFR
jgi:hypothetical protein